jgi:hypothetical protein
MPGPQPPRHPGRQGPRQVISGSSPAHPENPASQRGFFIYGPVTMTPTPVDLLIEARYLIPVEPYDTTLEHHSDRRPDADASWPSSHSPRPAALQRRETVSLPEHVVTPGLVNLHCHAAMTLMRGLADDLPLMRWLQEAIWPAEARHASPPSCATAACWPAPKCCAAASPPATTCTSSRRPAQKLSTASACGPCSVSRSSSSHPSTHPTPTTTCAKASPPSTPGATTR